MIKAAWILIVQIGLVVVTGSGCQSAGPGGATSAPAGIAEGGGIAGPGAGTTPGLAPTTSGTEGATTGSGSPAAAGGGDTMPPLADLPPTEWRTTLRGYSDTRLRYVVSPTLQVVFSYKDVEPVPMDLGDKSTFDHNFLLEGGDAPLACYTADCWNWKVYPAGSVLRVRLTRTEFGTTKDYFRDFILSPLQEDGSNLNLAGVTWRNEDVLTFRLYIPEGRPSDYATDFVMIPSEESQQAFFEKSWPLGLAKIVTKAPSFDLMKKAGPDIERLGMDAFTFER